MFNLEDYEDVATLNKWFIENYPMGRSHIVTEFHDPDKGYIRVRAEIYRDVADLYPAVTNIAFGARDLYNRNMARYYVEDIATSALGRAIILLKGSNKTATRESMEEVAKTESAISSAKAALANPPKEYIPVAVEDDPWTIKNVEPPKTSADAIALVQDVLGATKIDKDIPHCAHGAREWRTGNKNGKAWANMSCSAKPMNGERWSEVNKCDPIWYVVASDGTWKPQEPRS